MTAGPGDIVVAPEEAGAAVRRRLGLAAEEELRISYIPGPGDIAGTYAYWMRGEQDPRRPTVAYSTMFLELARRLGARSQILTQEPAEGAGDDEVSFVYLPRPHWSGRLSFYITEHSYARAIADRVREFAPHIVVASTDCPPAAWSSCSRHSMVVLSAHNTFWPMDAPPPGPKKRLKRWLLKRHARRLSGAVCTSEECRSQLRALVGAAIPAEVEAPQLPRRFTRRHREKARRFLFIGRIEADKGIFDLLDAFVSCARDYPDATLAFGGEGGAATALGERIAALGDDRISCLGLLDSIGVHAALDQADVVVCPTRTGFNEGLSTVPLEAAGHGAPSVVSTMVPARTVLGEGCVTHRADDVDALAAALRGLMADDDAFRELQTHLAPVTEPLLDRSRSWGSMLYRVLAGEVGAS